MKRLHLLAGAALALTSAFAIAQDAPESLLAPGFDRPARPARQPAAPAQAAPNITAPLVVEAAPQAGGSASASPKAEAATPAVKKLPSLAELEAMTPDQLDELFGLRPKTDMPAAARRSMKQVGVLDASEGGLPPGMLAGQSAALVRALLKGNNGTLVSRWGHIMLRRVLASRLDAPEGMNPADFAALRAALLVRMGEGEAARALVQDVDAANFTPDLTQAAVDAYVATADFTGICPVMSIHGGARKDPQWQALRAICQAFQGAGNAAMTQLNRQMGGNAMPRIDMLLAQKYAGAAGKARRNVTIEWDGVSGMTPWRYGLAIATGLEPPASLMQDAGARYDYTAATAPMLGLPMRAQAAERAAARGILSSAAMVDLYSQIYAIDEIKGDPAARAELLRTAFVGDTPAARLEAMQQLWSTAPGSLQRHSREVLTAYAAARLEPDAKMAGNARGLIASMLAAGLDQNALRWASVVDVGSPGWALLACAAPIRSSPVEAGALTSFYGADDSEGARQSTFLLAALAGLGRITPETQRDLAEKIEVNLGRETRWSQLIQQAAEVDNPGLVALLAAVGMQGESWDKMTPLHLYHIVSALNRVGLQAEARMIAAEAVARG